MTAIMDEEEDDCGHGLPAPCRLCQYERNEFLWEEEDDDEIL